MSGAQIELQHKVHVLTKKEELDSVRVQGKVVIVLDILFATTTMVAVLANGAREVVPVLDEAAARACALGFARDGCVLAGELYAETLPGFAHPAPLALIEHGVRDKTVVYSTTNGTVAMTDAAGAARIYCGALLNARRLVEHIVANHARETVLILCSCVARPLPAGAPAAGVLRMPGGRDDGEARAAARGGLRVPSQRPADRRRARGGTRPPRQ
jgi:2-phosphosulfolactate phosphatase